MKAVIKMTPLMHRVVAAALNQGSNLKYAYGNFLCRRCLLQPSTVGGQIVSSYVTSSASLRFCRNSQPEIADLNLPAAKTGRVASKDERRAFLSAFPEIVHDLTEIGSHSDIPDAQKWYAKVLQYNVTGGKMNRGLAVVLSYKLLAPPEMITEEALHHAHILGWCIELMQSFFLVSDDIIDGSEMRRGKPCWYKNSNLGLSAFNDALLLEAGIYKLLHKHFQNEPYYVDMLNLFHDMTLKTALGQCLDLQSSPAGQRPNLEKFTMERYNAIVKYKTAYYSFYLPVALAMYMAGIRNTDYARVAGITDRELHRQARTILLEMGSFFQVQDDYLDCFGDPRETGKQGNDIAEGKCTWLAVVALQRATPGQRKIMGEHYGDPDPASVEHIHNLYKELKLPASYKAYEESTSSMIRIHIQQISRGLNHNVFFKFLDKIHKRSS